MSTIELQASTGLLALIEANAPFWGAEAEVIRSYWDAPIRNAETDRKWLTHQVYKEYWDGVLPPLALFNEYLPKAGAQAGRKKLLEIAEVMYEEVEHFSMFADLKASMLKEVRSSVKEEIDARLKTSTSALNSFGLLAFPPIISKNPMIIITKPTAQINID